MACLTRWHVILTFLLLAGFFSGGVSAGSYRDNPGPFQVQVIEETWSDKTRDREVPVRIYYPETTNCMLPVIIFSHGLGGSRNAGEAWGRHWASYGYVSAHIQHHGSDSAVWKNQPFNAMKNLKASAMDPMQLILRAQDVSFAVDMIIKLNGQKNGPLGGKCDPGRIGISGHSFGAATTLAVAGQVYAVAAVERTMADARLKAALALSPPVTRKSDAAKAYGAIRLPVFCMTGTEDDSPIGETKSEERRIPFDNMKAPDKYLLIFEGGDHMVFSGQARRKGDSSHDKMIHSLIRQSSMAFWDACLGGSAKAREWLEGKGFAGELGKHGAFEYKR